VRRHFRNGGDGEDPGLSLRSPAAFRDSPFGPVQGHSGLFKPIQGKKLFRAGSKNHRLPGLRFPRSILGRRRAGHEIGPSRHRKPGMDSRKPLSAASVSPFGAVQGHSGPFRAIQDHSSPFKPIQGKHLCRAGSKTTAGPDTARCLPRGGRHQKSSAPLWRCPITSRQILRPGQLSAQKIGMRPLDLDVRAFCCRVEELPIKWSPMSIHRITQYRTCDDAIT
jgi:hypothetical protein